MKFKIKNIFFTLVFTIILLFFSSIIFVNAVDKEYTINQANFDIYLTENGDAIITETWVVNFKKGEFTRFYKDIYTKNLNSVEQFNNIEIQSFTINGIECSKVLNNTVRNAYTYYASCQENSYTSQWFYPASSEKVIYKCTYCLTDIVKETDNNIALFCYRVVGANFEKNIQNTFVTIYLPDETNINVKYSPTDDYEIFEDNIVFTNRNSNGIQKYHIAMDSDIFFNLTKIDLKTIKEEEKLLFFKEWSVLIVPIVLIITPFIILTYKNKKEQKILRKKIKQNPNYINNLIIQLENSNIHPLQIRRNNFLQLNRFLSFKNNSKRINF